MAKDKGSDGVKVAVDAAPQAVEMAVWKKYGIVGLLALVTAGGGLNGVSALTSRVAPPPAGSAGYATREEVAAARMDCDVKIAELRRDVASVKDSAASIREKSAEIAEAVKWLTKNLLIQPSPRPGRDRDRGPR